MTSDSRRLGKYEILEEIGRGGFATVYRARDTTLERIVALKVLRAELLHDPIFVQRFEAEAKMAAQLEHPNIVRVYEVGQHEGIHYLAMELVDGQSLAQVLGDRGRLTVEQSLKVVRDVAAGLDAAHRKGFIHRDIKPSNILIRKDGTALVTDFGIAKAVAASFAASLSSTRQILGTLRYMSPEQAEEQPVTPQSDVYSLGVVLFEMLTGRPPFAGETAIQLIRAHADREPPRPSELNKAVTPAVESVVLRALAKLAASRYESAGQMAQALEAAARRGVVEKSVTPVPEPQKVAPTSRPTPPRPAGRGRSRALPLLAGVAGLLMLVLCVAVALPRVLDVLRPEPTSVPAPTTAVAQASPEPATSPQPGTTQTEAAPTLISGSPLPPSGTMAPSFGQSKRLGGLSVSVSPPDYDSGCGGTLDFEVRLTNETDTPLVLGLTLDDIRLLGDGNKRLSLFGATGAATPRCYGGFRLETLPPNSETRLALRTKDSLGGFSHLELVFGEKAGRLAGERWKLDLDAGYQLARTAFGQTVDMDGLQVTAGGESYFPGCNGTLGFEVTLKNVSDRPIILSLQSDNLRLYGDNGNSLMLWSKLGSPSTECYGGFRLETLAAGSSTSIAVRTTGSLRGLSHVDFVFETTSRLDGLRWRLNLPR